MNESKTTVIYHSADYDGIFCREVARHHLGDKAQYIGWNFGDPKIPFPMKGICYVLDLSPECLNQVPMNAACELIWIDHHKTSIEKWPITILGYRIDGVAACRLAWQWFHGLERYKSGTGHGKAGNHGIHWFQSHYPFPKKEDYINRTVEEPLAVRLAGEYDIWDKRDWRAETFQYGLRASENLLDWDQILSNDLYAIGLVESGQVAQRYGQHVDESVCKSRTWLMDWEGLKFLCVNSARFNSQLFASKDVSETGHDALLGFCFNGKVWTVSLYHAKHRTDIDLSTIAVRYGGGGHRGACGFTCDKLPFLNV